MVEVDYVHIILAVVVVLLLICVYYVKNAIRVIRFYRPSCPACQGSQEEWDKFKSGVGMWNMIIVKEVNTESPSVEDKALISNFAFDTVPAYYKYTSDGMRLKYEGPRNADALMKMATTKSFELY